MSIQKMAKHLEFGKHGESEAKKFLCDQGYQILETNWRFKHWEVDIIAKDIDVLVFVEVKSRTSLAFGEPFSFVNHKKQKNLIKVAEAYLKISGYEGDIRFDIVSICILNNKKKDVQLIKDAFWSS